MRPSRRTVLRGAGVALALPWLESLVPRAARAQQPAPRRTFVAFYFPCGVSEFWKPATPGAGNAWSLSPILEPLTPLKSQVTVLANVGNYGPFGGHVEPSHSNLTAAYLTCAKPVVSNATGVSLGISADQVIAQGLAEQTKLPSLQLGLSTLDSYTDGLPAPCSRSISWSTPTNPLFKVVDPQKVFDTLVMAGPVPSPVAGAGDPFADARRAGNKSVLDYVVGHATSVRGKLGRSDQARMDGFLASVRDLETRVQDQAFGHACTVLSRPSASWDVGKTPPGYDRGVHADLMIDLTVMALQCGLTRVASFMLDDSRSDFVYNFLKERTFTSTGSTEPPGAGPCGSLHGLSAAGNSNSSWATVNRWFVLKLARLCTALQATPDGAGTMLDNATVWFGSEMHGGNHDGLDLPVLYVGGGGSRLKTNQFIDFATTARGAEGLGNVYLTFIQKVFDLAAPRFGDGSKVVPEILV